MDDSNANHEAETRPVDRLHLRQSRFQGAQLAGIRGSPACRSRRSDQNIQDETAEKDETRTSSPPLRRHGLGSNVRKRRSLHLKHSLEDSSDLEAPRRKPAVMSPVQAKSVGSYNTSDELQTVSVDSSAHTFIDQASESNSSRPRHTARKVNMGGPSFSGETSPYIDHLESQLAAAQTQLELITASSVAKTHLAKLRNLHTENLALRQEVTEWEDKFDERARSKDGKCDTVADQLRKRVDLLEKECTQRRSSVDELEATLEDQRRGLEMTEQANRELEKRLELMSSLVAASPTKLDLYISSSLGQSCQSKRPDPSRQLSGYSTRSSRPSNTTTPVQATQVSNDDFEAALEELVPARHDTWSKDASRITPRCSRDSEYSTDVMCRYSESATSSDDFSDVDPTPSRRQSMTPICSQSDGSKPARRMRRFYTGSARQSLILPSTNNMTYTLPSSASEHNSSAPIPMCVPLASGCDMSSPEVPPSSPLLNHISPTIHLQGTRRRATHSSSNASNEAAYTPVGLDVRIDDHGHGRRTSSTRTSQPYSVSHNTGRNLFDELNRIKQERDRSCVTSTDSTATLIALVRSPPPTKNQQPNVFESGISPLIEPAEEPDIDRNYYDSPHVASPREEAASSNLPLPGNQSTLHSFVSFLSYLSRCSVNSACCMISRTWERLTLSRPVLEFRLWLVHILLKRLLVTQNGFVSNPSPSILALEPAKIPCPTSRVGLGIAGARSRRGSPRGVNGENLSKAHGIGEMREVMGTCIGEKLELTLGREYDDDEGSNNDRHPVIRATLTEATTANTYQPFKHATPAAIAWLKLSTTLIAAVGMALARGPNSLFDDR